MRGMVVGEGGRSSGVLLYSPKIYFYYCLLPAPNCRETNIKMRFNKQVHLVILQLQSFRKVAETSLCAINFFLILWQVNIYTINFLYLILTSKYLYHELPLYNYASDESTCCWGAQARQTWGRTRCSLVGSVRRWQGKEALESRDKTSSAVGRSRGSLSQHSLRSLSIAGMPRSMW